MKKKSNTLKLVLSVKAYEITGTPEKMYELRRFSKYIKQRIFNEYGCYRAYDFIEFQCAFGKNPPRKKFRFLGVEHLGNVDNLVFSNGLEWKSTWLDIKINFENI